MTSTLVLLRHGQSLWNAENLFTGWWDIDLSALGEQQAVAAGELMAGAGLEIDVAHTSLQTRSIRTADFALEVLDSLWVPVRRSWRLNERHYGDLTGRNKKESTEHFGAEQVHVWRRSYDTPPEPISAENLWNPNNDRRYRAIPPELIPATECLKDVVERMLPYWYDSICPDLAADRTVLVAAHGNSLRALVKHLDGISDADIADLDIPTGIPLVYELDAAFRPVEAKAILDRYLGDQEAIRAAADEVRRQAGGA